MNTKHMQTVMGLIEEFRKLHPEFPPQMMLTFLWVAHKPGITLRELTQHVGTSQSSMNKVVLQLAQEGSHGREGYNLVRTEFDPSDAKRKIVFLAPKGKRVLYSLTRLMEQAGNG